MQLGVWDKIMRGLSTRNYGTVVKEFHNAYGIEKSAVSENFIEASREKVKELMERPLGELRLCAIVIDGTPFKDRQMIVALGIGCDGRNPHRTQAASAGPTAPDLVLHQRDRICFFHPGNRLPQRQTLARRRSHRALGGIGPAGRRAPVSQGRRIPPERPARRS